MAVNNENKTKIRLIGTGMDGSDTLTEAARTAIANADAIFGARRVTEPFEALGKPVFHIWKASEIAEVITNKGFERPCVLMSGDCGFYSAADGFMKGLDEFDTEIICGISAPVYFSSKIKIPWQDMKFVSLHGAENSVVRSVRRNKHCFFLLGGDVSAEDICGCLCDYGLGDIKVYIGENLGYPNEKISVGKARDFADLRFESLCVLVAENPEFERGVPIGISDGEFLRRDVPMTKSEVRAVIISKLGIEDGDVCWDIGCGTGSVSVEMALNCGAGEVYAVDRSENAVLLTAKNCQKFGCDNVFVYGGLAPAILAEFPAPDRVFIGGSGGRLEDILDIVFLKNPRCTVVVTAITLETISSAMSAFTAYGIDDPEIVQIAVTRTKRAGKSTLLQAENPVFVIKAKLEGER